MLHAGFERPAFVFPEPPQTIAAFDLYVASIDSSSFVPTAGNYFGG
jgi:hypothetical protein